MIREIRPRESTRAKPAVLEGAVTELSVLSPNDSRLFGPPISASARAAEPSRSPLDVTGHSNPTIAIPSHAITPHEAMRQQSKSRWGRRPPVTWSLSTIYRRGVESCEIANSVGPVQDSRVYTDRSIGRSSANARAAASYIEHRLTANLRALSKHGRLHRAPSSLRF